MNAGAKLGLNQAAPTAAAKQAAKDSEPPTRGQGEILFEKWIEFLKRIKNSVSDLPVIVLMKTLNFYRENVDKDVDMAFTPLEHRVFAYALDDELGRINFFTIDGVWIRFEWVNYAKTINIYFDHLARPEESAY